MERFRGTNPLAVSICNRLQDIIITYNRKSTKLDAILYLGMKEMYAVNTIVSGDPSIERDPKTNETRLYGFLIVEVMRESYAALSPSIMLDN